MKTNDFNKIMNDIRVFTADKRLAVYKYNTFATFTDDGIKQANALNINIHVYSVKIDYYKLYDLQPSKSHSGSSYQDSKTVSMKYYDFTAKQLATLNDFLQGVYDEQV